MRSIEIFDTTLRDGAQGEGISFSVRDKLAVTEALDELGVAFIEAGNPGSNPKDLEFFREVKKLRLRNARLCAFGSTRKKGAAARDDANLRSILEAETPVAVIFGKSSPSQVKNVLKASLEENLAMIAESVSFLREAGREVIYDAEHFFDGWKEDPAYALQTLRAAACGAAANGAGAAAFRLVLCDTNGGSFPWEIARAVTAVLQGIGGRGQGVEGRGQGVEGRGQGVEGRGQGTEGRGQGIGGRGQGVGEGEVLLGIHAHNDMGLAVSCALSALEAGAVHVQGTLTGAGERCGNTCLSTLIPSLELKLNARCLPEGGLARMTELTRKVAEISNITLPGGLPYIGASAFAHKAGMHADAIIKTSVSFEHIEPALVGNGRHFLISEMGGRSAIAERLRHLLPGVTKDDPVITRLSKRLKELEAEGWQFEGADASFEILARKLAGSHESFFSILTYRVASEYHAAGALWHHGHGGLAGGGTHGGGGLAGGGAHGGGGLAGGGGGLAASVPYYPANAWVKVLAGSECEIAAAEGDGPVNALDQALRRALARFFPLLNEVRLDDYKVRVIDGNGATAAKVRVLIESTDGRSSWTTVGVSTDVIDASRQALVDSIEYKLFMPAQTER